MAQSTDGVTSLPLQNIRLAFIELGNDVKTALNTQLGDSARLSEHKRRCLQFSTDISPHTAFVPPAEYQIIRSSIDNMISSLDAACQTSSDFPDAAPNQYGKRIPNGRVGRPSVDITPGDLETYSVERTTRKQIAELYSCSERTIRRRLLAFGLSSPGPPVYTEEVLPDGTTSRTYRAGVCSDLSTITDAQLDQIILSLYEQFPSFGRQMIDGYLIQLGERVPRSRIYASYNRVIGPSTATFGSRRITRRVYSVPGPGSLWHHDGQHGLIRWKIVIHAFIDGFSRYVLGIRASNNNRSETVVNLFEDIALVFGYPSRTRGDHGTENLLVAARMEQVRGLGRGSYIWGRSVHNIRIERLWVDVTSGFGSKWSNFLRGLEASEGLNQNIDGHIWLIQHLFLDAINEDASTWAAVWNHHTLTRRGEPNRTPHNMYLHGVAENGHRSIFPVDIDTASNEGAVEGGDEAFANYGIDWDDLDISRIQRHHAQWNSDEQVDHSDPFVSNQPDRLSHVEVPEPRCPFTIDQVHYLDARLAALPIWKSMNMNDRRLLWIEALTICSGMPLTGG